MWPILARLATRCVSNADFACPLLDPAEPTVDPLGMTATDTQETTFLDVDGRKTEVLTGGSGDPLVYLHSAGGETEWTPFHAAVGEHFRVHAPAHPGFSYSEGLDQVRDIDDMAWAVIDNIAGLGLSDVPCVGFSLGGWLAAEVAVRRPGLFSKIVLVNPAGVRVEGSPMGDLWQDDFAALRELLFHDPNDLETIERAIPLSMEDARILPWLKAREATARVAWNPYLHNPKLVKHLHRIDCPVRVVQAAGDKLLPLAGGQLFAETIPNAELCVVENAGHMFPWEQPEEFGRLVTEFCT